MKTPLRTLVKLILAGMLAAACLPAGAAIDLVGDDTDLFTTNPNIPSQIPNVLIILDNTSNWSAQNQQWPGADASCTAVGITGTQQGDAEVCALYQVIANLDEQVNVGLMMFNDQDKGGYVRFGVKPMNTTNRTNFQTVLKEIATNTPEDKTASNSAYDNPMNDAFRYFNSLATFSGTTAGSAGGPPTSTSSPSGTVRAELGAYTGSTRTAFQFLANTKDNSCGYDYIIFIGNGFPNAGTLTPNIDNAAALLNDTNVVVDKSVLNNVGRTTDNWAKFMFQYGVKVGNGVYRHITTYTINVCKDSCDASQEPLLKSMATVSQGKYFKATNFTAIKTALSQVFAEVQAVNSVFAATTLPVSINVRGTNLNQVYIGVFRPDPALSPRWLGNLKQYQLGVTTTSTGQLALVDANNTVAVNLNTGFITNTASSIWTETSTFFSYRSPYAQTDVGGASDKPDGDLVEKGGAAQKIRQVYANPDSTTAMTRKMYTCTGACAAGSSLKDYLFNSANTDITAQKLGTFASLTVSSITGTGSTATATTSSAHGFSATNQVVIAGATPSYYNGTFSVASVPSTTTFTYSVSPTTIDTTHAYATWPGYTLTPGNDTVTVTSASPSTYNVTAAAISAVSGNVNQFSYTLGSAATSAASGYTITANRKATSVIYSSATGKATAIVPNHGYATATTGSVALSTSVVIAGATPSEFNGTYATISNVTANSFDYVPTTTPTGGTVTTAVLSPIPTGITLTPGTSIVQVSGSTNTTYNTATCTSSSTSNVTAVDTANNKFTYSPGGTVSGSAAGTITVQNCAKTDIDTYPITGITTSGSGANTVVRVTLSGTNTPTVSGQAIHTLAVNDPIAVQGITCSGRTCNTTNSTTYSFTVAAVNGNQIDFQPGGTGNITGTPTASSSAAVFWTGVTLSPAVTATSVTIGSATVTATGTVTTTVAGDLTSKVTSLTSQGVATGTMSAALATSADPNERANLIGWVRGLDNKDNENLNNDATDVRMSVHGDVLHSRPAVVNYNRNGDDNDVYIFYGSNDGLLRAIKGGSLASGGGKEAWTFVAPEFFGKLKRQRDQTPSISSNSPRDYFFDGPITVYTLDADKNGKLEKTDASNNPTGDKVYVYVGMRRGGRMYYAFDVTDPLDPKLLWKKGCSEATGSGTAAGSGGCDSGFGEIGQTWSQPQLGYLRKWPTTLALIFAAGYDKDVEDPQPCFIGGWSSTTVTYKQGVVVPTPMDTTKCTYSTLGGTATTKTRAMGRGVFILNAADGSILWRAGPDSGATKQVADMTYSMPGDVAVLRNRSNTASRAADIGTESIAAGYLDRVYAASTGGNLWRIDVSDASGTSSEPPAFAVSKLASIATAPASGTHAALNYRKFMFSPDVVYSSDGNGAYDAVLLGSGDREHPFDAIVANRFYMFKDRNINSLAKTSIDETSSDATVRWAAPTVGIITDTTSSTTPLFDVTNNCIGGGTCDTGQTVTQAKADLLAAKGWKFRYTNEGEKTIGPGTTAAGTIIFNSNQPKQDTVTGTASNTGSNAGANQCTSDLGTARQYGINYQDATAGNIFNTLPTQYVPSSGGGRFAVFAGGGFLPTPVPVVVQIGGKYYQTVIAGVQTTNPGGLKLQSRVRTYWYRKVD